MSETNGLPKITNRPGLSALSYRIGDYASFRNNLLAQLSQVLPNLKTRDPDDAAIALLDAWAVVADVLTFYQERIANEGYLNTATDRQSMIELARLIGYELKPGVSASTHLAFTIEDKPGGSPPSKILQGTQVMSIPGEGELPQIFETSEDILASPVWNALRPRLSKPQEITRNTRQLYLKGTSTRLEVGDWLLLAGTEDQREKAFLLALKTVQPIPLLETTLISWDYDLEDFDPKTILRHPQIFAFRQRAGLFGNNAPRWDVTPDDLKRKSRGVQLKGGVFSALNPTTGSANEVKWASKSVGLPNQDILCLAVRQTFWFAGTEGSGIFRLDPTDAPWQPINNGLTNLNIQTLFVMDEERGYLLAGTPSGGVFRSKDNGETWTPIGAGNIRIERKTSNGDITNTVNTGIPNVVVRSLLAYTIGQTSFIFAGTDDDIYRTTNQGQDWSSSRITSNLTALPNYEQLSGLPNKVIHALLSIPEKPGHIIGIIKEVKSYQIITIEGLSKTPKKGDAITVEGQTRRIAKIDLVTIILNQPFGSDVSQGTAFTGNNISGMIDTVDNQKIQITQVGHIPRESDQIAAAGQTKKITNVYDDISITATLRLETAFQPDLSLGADFVSSLITGKINRINTTTNGQLIEVNQASGILKPGDQITAEGQTRIITEVIQYTITATVELEEAFQPSVKKETRFNTLNQSEGRITDIDIEQKKITVDDITERLQVGDTFTAGGQTRVINQIEDFTLTLEEALDPKLVPDLSKLKGKKITSTAIRIFAGTDQGVYHSDDHGKTWSPDPSQGSSSSNMSDKEIYALDFYAFDNKYYVLAGTSDGVWICEVSSESLVWNPAGIDKEPFKSLQILADTNYAFAGTDKGVFRGTRSNASTWTWEQTQDNYAVKKITSIAIGTDSSAQVFAGAKFSGFTEEPPPDEVTSPQNEQTEWPNFYIQDNQIDLDTLYPKILKDSWVVLLNQSQESQQKNLILPPHSSIKVEQVSSEQRQGFTLDAKVTRLLPSQTIQDPERFSPRSTVVLAQSEVLALAEISLTVSVQQDRIFQDPIWDNKIFLSQYVHGLEAKKTVIVSGKHVRAKVNAGGIFRSRNWKLLSPDFVTENIQELAFREADKQLFAVTKTGVWRLLDGSQYWQSINGGLKNVKVNSIAIYGKSIDATLISREMKLQGRSSSSKKPFSNLKMGDILTVSKQVRVIKKVGGINSQEPSNELELDAGFGIDLLPGKTGGKINRVFVGTDKGVYRLQENLDPPQWTTSTITTPKNLQNVQILLINPKDHSVVAGTQSNGVFILADDSEIWQPKPFMDKVSVLTLAADSKTGNLFAGTEENGVFCLSYGQDNWQSISAQLPDFHILSLVVQPASSGSATLFAGTATRGVFRQPANSENKTWEPVNTNLPDLQILNLFLDSENNYLIAGTKGGGIFRLSLDSSKAQVWESIEVGLGNQVVQCLAIGPQNRLLAGTPAGIFQELQPANPIPEIYWEHSNQGLIYSNVQTLVPHRFGGILHLFAGTKAGVFRSLNQGQTWELMNQGLKNTEIQTLLPIEESLENGNQTILKIFAGTKEGLFYSTDKGKSWQNINLGRIRPNVQALAIHESYLLAGTLNTGIFRSSDNGNSWTGVGLTKQDIRVLLSRHTEKDLLVGTAGNGIFRSINNGDTWEHWTDTRPGSGMISSNGVTVTGSGTKFLSELQNGDKIEADGQIRTVVSIQDKLTVNTAFNPELERVDFRVRKQGETVTPGTGEISSNGLVVTGNNTEFLTDLKIGDVIEANNQTRTVVSIDSELVVDSAFKPALQSQNFVIYTGLGNLYITALLTYTQPLSGTIGSQGTTITGVGTAFTAELHPGDTIAVRLQGREHTRTVNTIESVASLTIDQAFTSDLPAGTPFKISFLLAGTAGSGVFRAPDSGQHWAEANQGLQDLEIRCLTVDPTTSHLYAGTATGGLFQLSQGSDRWEPISARLTNTDVRAILVEESNLYVGGIGTLSSLDGVDFVELQPDDLLRVVAAPTETEIPNGQTTIDAKEWQVLDRDNFKGKLTITQSDDIQLYSAAEEDPVVSEIAVIQSPPDDEDRPVVTLDKPLQQSYDPATVKVYANVVEATHGETVSEILGSGSGAATNQRFALSKPPLTHIAATDATGSKSELKVYVNDVRWTQVPSLYPLDKQDRSYILRIEDDGTTTITFGDGQRGARLPSGRENITATYRSGIGLAGNVGAARIALKKTGPPSIQGVTNPLPSTGAASSESLESARSTIPATTRTLDRIVSRRDFEDFTQAFAGIGKAQAVTLWNGTSELVYITIAAVGGEAVLPDSALYRNLVAAIDQSRDPIQPLQIVSFQPLFFNIEARVMHQDGYQAEKVEAAIRQSLLKTFAFEQRSFGQSVTKSEVIAAIQSAQGVLAVDLDFLHRQDASRTLQPFLPAITAFWDAKTKQVQPSQLLILRSSSIKLTVGETL